MCPSLIISSFTVVRTAIESAIVVDKKNNIVVAAYLLNSRIRDGVNIFNVHPIVAQRFIKGEFIPLFSDLQGNELLYIIFS